MGNAAAADTLFLRSIRNRRMSSDHHNPLRSIQLVVMAGLAVVVISAFVLALHNSAMICGTELLAG